tara:strand:+ start:3101 stop:3337 length:237 start_codon:yes stop_codon:yes gene_type:complete
MKTARVYALHDISEHIKNDLKETFGSGDVWFVSATALNTKENQKLNRRLGVNRVNHLGNKNGTRTKTSRTNERSINQQ